MNLRKRLATIGALPRESDDMRLRRTVTLIFAAAMSLAGVIWGVFALLFYQDTLAMIPPFGYAVVSLINVLHFAESRRFARFRLVQLAASLLLPFFMMLQLGGFVQGSATILWSLLAPLVALLVADRRQATAWFAAFLLLVVAGVFLEPLVSRPAPLGDAAARTILFGMNIIGPWTAAFVLLRRFLQQKDETLQENVRLYQETRRQADEMSSLAEIGADIVATLDLDTLLARITSHGSALLRAESCAVYLLQADGQSLRLIAGAGAIPDAVKAFEPQIGEGIIGHVARSGVAEIIADTSADPRLVTLPGVAAARLTEKMMVAPLFSRREVIGVMSVWRPAGERWFNDADLSVLQRLARQASIAITNARLYEETAAARAAAVAANEAKSAFLAAMSHEIRTPMNAVIGMTSLLLDTAQTAEQREFTETIRSSGEMLLLLINDILDFSKIEAGQLDLEERPFDLRAAVESALDLIAVRAADKGLDLAYTIAPDTPETIVGDVTRLRQILINLLSNAVKFTEKGEVVVSVSSEQLAVNGKQPAISSYQLRFLVRDTGIGIPADRMDRLFRSFSQVDASTTRTYGGTGLGLAISKRLVGLMGGEISVESEVGVGSVFSFTLQAASAPGPERAFLHDVQPHLHGRRLLIVDDNATNRRILQRQAEAWGMTTCTIADPLNAVAELCRDAPFDAAILDMQMPQMDGLALADALRAVQQGKDLPLLLLTSLGGLSGAQRQTADQTFAVTLTKPVKPSQLYEALLHVFLGRPIRIQRETAVRASEFDAQMGQRLPLRILLVDDNSTNQKLGLRLLQRLGYRADVAGRGLEAITAVQRQPYDVVLMDVQMPVMDGLEATRRIRQLNGRQPYIVATTADVLMDDRGACRTAGMDDFLTKPIRVQALIDVLERSAGRVNAPPPLTSPAAAQADASAGERVVETAVDPAALDRLLEMMGGEPAYLRELIDGFLTEAPQLVAQIRHGVDTGDADAVRLAAHSLKANAADFGAARLHALTRQIETQARQNDLTNAAALAVQAAEAYALVEAALRAVNRKP